VGFLRSTGERCEKHAVHRVGLCLVHLPEAAYAHVLMQEPFQTSRRTARKGSPLSQELKEFLDMVVSPALVKEYVSEQQRENRLALTPEGVTQSVAMRSVSAESAR
jgi:hypothetical protein